MKRTRKEPHILKKIENSRTTYENILDVWSNNRLMSSVKNEARFLLATMRVKLGSSKIYS